MDSVMVLTGMMLTVMKIATQAMRLVWLIQVQAMKAESVKHLLMMTRTRVNFTLNKNNEIVVDMNKKHSKYYVWYSLRTP